jgi:hypothetical protein
MRVLIVLVCLTGVARADPMETGPSKDTGWYVTAGPLVGAAFLRDRGTGFVGGVVGTFVHLNGDTFNWYGLQIDAAADTNGDADTGFRFSIGPEVGQSIIGGSAGYFQETLDDTRHGAYGMVKLTTGFAALYLRVARVLSSDEDPTSLEIGLQAKLPVWGFD